MRYKTRTLGRVRDKTACEAACATILELIMEIITRRSLPHWYVPGAHFFVTYRLTGTIPQTVRERLQARGEELLKRNPNGLTVAQHRMRVHKILFGEYDHWLDNYRNVTLLNDPRIAAVIRRNLYYHHGTMYNLLAYCIMPNHVHVLFQPLESLSCISDLQEIGERDDGVSPLSRIMHSLKSYTAHRANRILLRSGAFWQRESYDHWVRDEEELERIVDYILANPVRARLVERPQDWFFCSCHDRFLSDGEVAGWLKWET